MPIAQLKLNETGKSKTNNALSFSPGTRECLYEESCVKILKKRNLVKSSFKASCVPLH